MRSLACADSDLTTEVASVFLKDLMQLMCRIAELPPVPCTVHEIERLGEECNLQSSHTKLEPGIRRPSSTRTNEQANTSEFE